MLCNCAHECRAPQSDGIIGVDMCWPKCIYLWVVGGTRWPFVFGEHRQEHPRTTWNHLTESDMIWCHMCVHPYTSLVMIVAVFLNHWCKGMVNQQMRILFEWFWMKVLNELAQLTTLPMRHPRIQPLVAVGRWRLGFEAPNTPRIGDFPTPSLAEQPVRAFTVTKTVSKVER